MLFNPILLGVAGLAFKAAAMVVPRGSDLPFPEWHFNHLAAATQMTYCDTDYNQPGHKLLDMTLLESLGNIEYAQRTNVYHSDSLGIVVACQGTNLSNVISSVRDVAFPQLPTPSDTGLTPDALVFAGWLNAFQISWKSIKESVANALKQYPGANLIVTGHSQGSAYSELVALALEKIYGQNLTEVITFGPPRVGNAKYAKQFNERFQGRHAAVANGNDWVPLLPFTIGPADYQRVDGFVWINPTNSSTYIYSTEGENQDYLKHVKPHVIGKIKEWQITKQFPFFDPLNWSDHRGFYMGLEMAASCPPLK